jgi:iron complex outermembrane receptor protein
MFLLLRRVLALTVLALGILPIASARLAAQAGTITGKVTDAGSGRPIENVGVSAEVAGGQRYGAITGADGSFRINNLPDGSYTVTARLLGYERKSAANIRPGQTIDFALTQATTTLSQTVVTASRSRPEKALDAPAQISVISSERIESTPAVTVTDHLRSTPGIDINRGGIAQANVVARGFNNAFSGSMLMLQDYRFAGVPSLRVNVPFLFTGTNEDIDRMEVLLGPASALYGPNSSNGVLHVITKSPFNSQGTTISVDGGERSVIRTGVRTAQKLNENLAFKLSGEYMQGRDWEYNDRSEPTTFPGTANVPAARRGQLNQRDFDLQRFTGEARMDVRPSANSEAITTVGYTNVGSGLELTGANGTAQIKNWTYLSVQQRFRWNKLFAQVFLNSSDAGNDNAQDASGTYLLRSGQPIVDKSRVAAGQLQHGFDLGKKQSFTYGVDYIWTNPQTGNTINGANEDRDNVTEYGGYVQSTTRPSKYFEVLLAARGDANNVIAGNFFSPRAALILKPTENQNVRFSYNRAFSTPGNFSFFLDLIQTPNAGGSGFDVWARGNPPKQGFTFNRSCGGSSQFGDLCMKSPFTGGGQFVGASAAAAYPGFVQGAGAAIAAGLATRLQAQGLPQPLAQALANAAVTTLRGITPTNATLGTRAAYITSGTVSLAPSNVTTIDPLKAAMSNTYEFGYKGILGNKFRWDIAFWGQDRADFSPAAVATPTVFANGAQVGALIGGPLTAALQPILVNAGVPAAQIPAILTGTITGVGTTLASAPMGTITFDDPNTRANAIYATYFSTNRVWVRGLDVATDVAATDRVTLDLSYSWQNRNVFTGINGGNSLPLMSNSPGSRGSLGLRYQNDDNGVGFNLRGRYSEAYPVNSGVYVTNFSTPIAAGQTGATTTSPSGAGARACNPAPAGSFCYEEVPEAFIMDAQVSKRFNLGAQKLMWSLNATNLFDNRVRTFPGVPEIGRMIMTRIQYSF